MLKQQVTTTLCQLSSKCLHSTPCINSTVNNSNVVSNTSVIHTHTFGPFGFIFRSHPVFVTQNVCRQPELAREVAASIPDTMPREAVPRGTVHISACVRQPPVQILSGITAPKKKLSKSAQAVKDDLTQRVETAQARSSQEATESANISNLYEDDTATAAVLDGMVSIDNSRLSNPVPLTSSTPVQAPENQHFLTTEEFHFISQLVPEQQPQVYSSVDGQLFVEGPFSITPLPNAVPETPETPEERRPHRPDPVHFPGDRYVPVHIQLYK